MKVSEVAGNRNPGEPAFKGERIPESPWGLSEKEYTPLVLLTILFCHAHLPSVTPVRPSSG